MSRTATSLRQHCAKWYKSIIANDLSLVIALGIILIIVGLIIGLAGSLNITLNTTKHARYLLDPHDRLSFLANWDGVDYLSIARHGYSTEFLAGWLPVYPILISVVDKILNSYLISALIISWASLIGALYYYLKVVKLYFKMQSNREALQAVLLFALFPTGVYLISVYTESLFAFLSLGAIYFALRKKYLASALFTMVATATHINGIYILLLILLLLIEKKESLKHLITTAVIGSLGLLSYMAFLLFKFSNPLAYLTAQRDHGWLHGSLLQHLGGLGVFNYVLALTVLLTTIYWWKRRKSFSIYAGLYLLIPLIGGQFGGFPRYSLMIFPLQFMLYEYSQEKKFVYPAIMMLFGVFWVYIVARFAAGYVVS